MMIAYCGLDCAGCPIHIATLEQDAIKRRSMRIEVARVCTEQYGINLKPEDVSDCDGCSVQAGRLFPGCAKCAIRLCAIARSITSCAFCTEYACNELLRHFQTDPSARTHLEKLRANR